MVGELCLHSEILWYGFGKSLKEGNLYTDLKFDIEINVEWLKEYTHEI